MPVPGSTVSSVNRNKTCPSPSFDARNLKNGELFNIFYVRSVCSSVLKRCNLGYKSYKRLDGLSKLKSCKIIDSQIQHIHSQQRLLIWAQFYFRYLQILYLHDLPQPFYNFIFIFQRKVFESNSYQRIFCEIKKVLIISLYLKDI